MRVTPSDFRYILCDWCSFESCKCIDYERPAIRSGEPITKVETVITSIKHTVGHWKPPKNLKRVETASAVCQR